MGQTLSVPRRDGASVIAVGVGDPAKLNAAALRDAAAALGRATGKHARVVTTLADLDSVARRVAGRAVVEGLLLSRYRYGALKKETPGADLEEVTLVVGAGRAKGVTAGAERGRVVAGAAQLARDLANTPPGHLTARRLAEIAIEVAASSGLEVDVFDEAALRGARVRRAARRQRWQ